MNEAEFDALVRQHAPAVGAYARATCRDRWTAEEAVQETFLRAWRYQDSFDRRGSFEGWLIRICRNCIIDLAQRESRLEHTVIDLERSGVAQFSVEPDQMNEIHALLAELPLPQREALVLCGVLGYDYASAAIILDVPLGTVRSRLSRARETMQMILADSADMRSA